MTVEFLLIVLKQAIQEVLNMFDRCVIRINSDIDISIAELVIGSCIVLFVIRISTAFAFRN